MKGGGCGVALCERSRVGVAASAHVGARAAGSAALD